VAEILKLQWFKQNRSVFDCHIVKVESQRGQGRWAAFPKPSSALASTS
jgi:hypothetical protein